MCVGLGRWSFQKTTWLCGRSSRTAGRTMPSTVAGGHQLNFIRGALGAKGEPMGREAAVVEAGMTPSTWATVGNTESDSL